MKAYPPPLPTYFPPPISINALVSIRPYTSLVDGFGHEANPYGHQSSHQEQEGREVKVVEVLDDGGSGIRQVFHTVRDRVGVLHDKTHQSNHHTNHQAKERPLQNQRQISQIKYYMTIL